MNILIFNKAKDTNPLFRDKSDVNRFVSLLHAVNNNIQLQSKWWKNEKWQDSPALKIVDLLAYDLNKKHIYLLINTDNVRNKVRFILRLKTSYTMYYNKKYSHIGPIFQAKHKVRNVRDEDMKAAKVLINNKPPTIKDIREVDEMIRTAVGGLRYHLAKPLNANHPIARMGW